MQCWLGHLETWGSDSMVESHCMGRLSAFNSSGVTGGVSAGRGADGVLSYLWAYTSTGEGAKGRQM